MATRKRARSKSTRRAPNHTVINLPANFDLGALVKMLSGSPVAPTPEVTELEKLAVQSVLESASVNEAALMLKSKLEDFYAKRERT